MSEIKAANFTLKEIRAIARRERRGSFKRGIKWVDMSRNEIVRYLEANQHLFPMPVMPKMGFFRRFFFRALTALRAMVGKYNG